MKYKKKRLFDIPLMFLVSKEDHDREDLGG
jgi:hypothetical protein